MACREYLRPPECVRGIKSLGPSEKNAFRKGFRFRALRVQCAQVSVIRGCASIFSCSIEGGPLRIETFHDIPDSLDQYLLLDPWKLEQNENRANLVDAYMKLFDSDPPILLSYYLSIGYDQWNAKACIDAILPENLHFSGISQVGFIVYVTLRDQLLPYKDVIGQVLVEKIYLCRTVLNLSDSGETAFNVRRSNVIAGLESFVTEVREHGLRYRLDVSKVFWNSDLSYERSVTVRELPEGCVFYDCSARVGELALRAAQKGVRRVLANDANPHAVEWLKKNISINNLEKVAISVHNLDARQFITEVVADDLLRWANTNQEGFASGDSAAPITKAPFWKPSSAQITVNLPKRLFDLLPLFRGLLTKRVATLSSTRVRGKLPFRVVLQCYFFLYDDARDNFVIDRFDMCEDEDAKRLIRYHIGSEKIKMLGMRSVRKVAPQKDLYSASFELPDDVLFANFAADTECAFEKPNNRSSRSSALSTTSMEFDEIDD